MKDDVIETQMLLKHDQVTSMTFVHSTQEQRSIVKIETHAKQLDIRKSNITKVALVFFTASMPTIETVETRHDKAATRHDSDGDRHDSSQY